MITTVHQTKKINGSSSILLPAWEVLVIATPSEASFDNYFCLFERNFTSPARFAGKVTSTGQSMFKCDFPVRVRYRQPFLKPVLTRFPEKVLPPVKGSPEMMRWNFLAYESISTENDVVLFVKGVNKHQGFDRPKEELKCVFGDVDSPDALRSDVTSSAQEVFRCHHPDLSAVKFDGQSNIKISLEMPQYNLVVPSVAYYSPWRKEVEGKQKSLTCACTMVCNVAKFLKEWVTYYASIGVQKFILYDNGSDDDLEKIVRELNHEGYDVELVFWIWQKTQEAGFSHSAIYAKSSCTWMMYLDVDEFLYSPSWLKLDSPNHTLITSMLPNGDHVGQVSIRCYEFGPSSRTSHPIEGVTQGYNCRRKMDQRHKSIVLLEGVDYSLVNAIHHFEMKDGYRTEALSLNSGVVNHYKYQAWPEFKTKFRRRVSAYVVDWMVAVNPRSQDRAPGLGFQPVEPEGWAHKFCEVKDDGFKWLLQRWFVSHTASGLKMAWQS